MYGPRIVGEKVVLRPHQPEDAEHFIHMIADPAVNQYLSRREPMSLSAELDWIEARATDPNSYGWTIEVDGDCVGIVGFDHIDWRSGVGMVGIFIGTTALWGQGVATEVATLLARHAFLELGLRKVKAGFLEPNVASGRLQARIGLVEVGRWHAEYLRGGVWVDHILTELHRDDWLNAQST